MRAYPAGAMKCVCVCIEENRIVERSCVSSFSHVSLSCVCLDRVIDDIIVSQVGVCVCVCLGVASPVIPLLAFGSAAAAAYSRTQPTFSQQKKARGVISSFSRSSIRVSAVNQAQLGEPIVIQLYLAPTVEALKLSLVGGSFPKLTQGSSIASKQICRRQAVPASRSSAS